MVDTLQFIVVSILISVGLIVPELVIENWLVKMGYVRDYKVTIIIMTLCLVFIKQLWFKDDSWWLWGTLTMLASILGVNRGELGETIKHGAWWWKSEKRKKKSRKL